ncbi:unnamed protein product [Prunus armeniaca]
MALFLRLLCLVSFLSFFSSSPATDTLTPSDMLRDNQTLVSSGGLFEFGFFSESVSGYYLGIWFTADPRNVVWVSNRDYPLLDSSALLKIRSGNLILTDRRQVQSIVNAGNVTTTSIIWQSFDAPSDTYLPGMKLGSFNLNTGHHSLHVVNSWASHQNPAPGLYTLSIDSSDLTKLSVWRGDGVKMNSNGSTNDYNFSLQFNRNEAFYTFSSSKNYDLMWLVMNSSGNLDQNFMLKGKIYSVSHPLCAGSNGGNNGTCLPSIPSQCRDGGAFSEMNGSLPSTSAGSGGSIGISECQTLCQVNCSCTAFASVQNESDQELPVFSFSTIKAATSDFAKANKLGEGGFGPGMLLPEGQEIAVKRLSKISRQGLKEFKNEISVILDSGKRMLLDWRKRMNIIEGIAQGLLYLHKYSRLRIIHRDLKTSNILLDCDMNPKISDFGMARIFEDNDTRGQTNRVVGTLRCLINTFSPMIVSGYMSPEYAMDGLFSEKSDVFSFGVIILEIVSGKKSISFFEADQSLNLLGKAWDLWKKGKTMELMDPTLRNYFSSTEVTRCIQMGLLCVQERAMDRPTMSDVVSTLSNETIALPLPKEPAFLSRSSDAESSSSRQRRHSGYDITISEVDGR